MKLILSALAVLTVSGCVGGVVAYAPPQTARGTVTTVADRLTPASGEAGQRLNAERAARGLGPLRQSRLLTQAAEGHVRDMARRGYFSHRSPDGGTIRSRVGATGYCHTRIAENIASGQRNAAQVFDSWMASAGHRRNILRRDLTGYGHGRVGNTWVLVLGAGC